MQGEKAMQHLVNIHFFSKQMGQFLSQRPAMLYFVFNAEVVTVLVAHMLREGEFVAQVRTSPFDQVTNGFKYMAFIITHNSDQDLGKTFSTTTR
jgi:hypothetical protein